MSDTEQPTKKRKGRPKGASVPQRIVRHTLNMGEAIREGVDPIFILRFHNMRVAGIKPIWILDQHKMPVDVIPDPSPLALAPTSTEQAESLKFITAYGWGQPVQSTTVDVEIRARLDRMGSGVSSEVLAGYNPAALKLIQQAFQLAAPAEQDAVDAEFTDLPDNNEKLEESKTPVNSNSE